VSARLILAAVLLVPALSACQRTGPLAPVTNVSQIPESAGGAVVVARGDTLYTLSRRYNVPLRDLMEVNRLSPPYTIEPGQRLVLPASRQYVVQKGDTLYGISRMFNVEVTELSRLNSLAAPYAVKTGQPLRLPSGGQRTFEMADAAGATPVSVSDGGPLPLVGPPPSKPSARGGIQTSELAPPGAVGAAAGAVATSAASATPSALPKVAAVPLPPMPSAGGGSPAGAEPGVTYQPGEAPRSLRPPGAKPVPPPAEGASPAAAPPMAESPPPPQEVAAVAAPSRPETAAPPPRGGARFLWPVKGKVLSMFGPKPDGMHNDGVNIAAPKGTPVVAADNGVVAYAGNELRGFGNLLLVRHADGWITAYAHLDRMEVDRGARVKRGQVIGRVGQSGTVTSPQLHFEVRKGSHAVDPREHLDGSQQVSEAASPAGRQDPG